MARSFIIAANGAVTFYDRVAQANASVKEGEFVVTKEADLAAVPTSLLVTVYNEAATKGEGKTITKFADAKSAHRRTFPVLDFLATKGKVAEGAARPRKAAKGESGQRGRSSSFAGKKLYKNEGDFKPRRPGSHGEKSFGLIRSGMTFETFIANGGRLRDLAHDVAYGRVRVE